VKSKRAGNKEMEVEEEINGGFGTRGYRSKSGDPALFQNQATGRSPLPGMQTAVGRREKF